MSQDEREKLEPCPFCGNETIAETHIRDGRSVACMKCSASVRAFQPNATAHAIKKWNTRSIPAQRMPWQTVREALEACRPEIERQRDKGNSDEEVAPYDLILTKIDAALSALPSTDNCGDSK